MESIHKVYKAFVTKSIVKLQPFFSVYEVPDNISVSLFSLSRNFYPAAWNLYFASGDLHLQGKGLVCYIQGSSIRMRTLYLY